MCFEPAFDSWVKNRRMRILLTAFEPFGADTENASLVAVDRLAERWDAEGDVQILTGVLPVVFGAAGTALRELVARYQPDAVLAVGEAGSRSKVTPELHGYNEMDARTPDNAGLQPRGEQIFAGGPVARPATLDVPAITEAIAAVGIPAEVSDDPGRYLCNYVAYLAAGLEAPAAFIHVPAVRSSGVATVGAETDPEAAVSAPALTFDDLVAALDAVVRETARQVTAGRTEREAN